MNRRRLLPILATLLLPCSILAGAEPESRSDPEPQRGSLVGTLHLRGCQVDPADIVLRAHSLPVPDTRTGLPLFPEETVEAAVSGVGRFGAMVFEFRDVILGSPYEIDVPEIAGPADCVKVLWKTADRGIVRARRRTRVRIDGFGIRSQIEILAIRDGRETDHWMGADALDDTDPSQALRRLRWKPNVRGATSGQLQVSMRPFPTPGPSFDPCSTPPLLYTRDFPLDRTDFTEIPDVDFARIAGGRASVRSESGADATDPSETFFPVTREQQLMLSLGAPLYVRVVPVSTFGRKLCATNRVGVTPIVIVSKVPFKKGPKPGNEPSIELKGATYEPPVVHTWPSGSQTCYRVIKDHVANACEANPFLSASCLSQKVSFNIYGAWLMWHGNVKSGQTAHPGLQFCVSQSSGGGGWFGDFIDSIGSVITGAIDSIAELVNYASYLWEKLQDLVVDAVASAINEIGIPCDATCRNGLELGLEVGLASMGVPPSIPNFDELVDQGLDYVAAQVAEQTGVPPAITDLATGKAKEFVQKAAADMKASDTVPGLPNWLTYDVGLEPAVLTLKVFGNVPQLPVTPFLFLASSNVFGGASVALPKKLPPSTSPLTIPIALQMNLEGLPEPSAKANAYQKAVYNKKKWVQLKLTDGCAELAMSAIAYQDWRVFMHAAVRAEDTTYYLTATGPFYCAP